MKNYLLMMLIFSVTAFFLVACGDDSSSDVPTNNEGESQTEETTEPESAEDRTLTIALGPDMLTFDIHNHTTTTTEAIHMNMFDYLFWNRGDHFEPHLAKSYELVDDVTWEFELNEGVLFHNGDELTAEDVKFTLERVATDDSLRSHGQFNQIKEVKVIDDYRFQIITHEPHPILLNRISRQGAGILPKNYIEENGWDHFFENPVGTGPFKFNQWLRDDRVVLDVYDDYFAGKVDDWDTVVFRVIPEDSTRVAELLTGGIDIAANIPPIDWDRVETDETTLVTGPSNRTAMLFIRSTEGFPTSDVRVRQAIDYAIDNQVLIDTVIGGGGTPSLTRVNPGNFGANEELYGQYNYDPDYARQLLEEAGYGDGVKIHIHSPNGRYLQDRETVEMVAGMLAEVGIEVEMEFMEWGAFVDIRQAQEHKDGYFIALGASLFDAAQSLAYYEESWTAGMIDWTNDEVEQLMQEASSSMDSSVRDRNYQRVQEIVAEEVPIIVLYQADVFFGINKRIEYNTRLDEAIYIPEDVTKK
ncbi:MAG: ABC transporter substrate-binding protein [Bacillus sp. (in: Bacteria)]|nr:ABC transporter substrate-binding protein [Bacillus sp. (in: firmicutes)]